MQGCVCTGSNESHVVVMDNVKLFTSLPIKIWRASVLEDEKLGLGDKMGVTQLLPPSSKSRELAQAPPRAKERSGRSVISDARRNISQLSRC